MSRPRLIETEQKVSRPRLFRESRYSLSHNKNALVRLANGYCMNTGVGNLIAVTTEQLNRQELEKKMGRIGYEFTHFASIDICEGVDLEQIKAFQDKMGDVAGIGKKKNPSKMHVTLGVFNLLDDEIEEAEMRFKKIGQKFSDLASPGSFLMNMKGLEMGDVGDFERTLRG